MPFQDSHKNYNLAGACSLVSGLGMAIAVNVMQQSKDHSHLLLMYAGCFWGLNSAQKMILGSSKYRDASMRGDSVFHTIGAVIYGAAGCLRSDPVMITASIFYAVSGVYRGFKEKPEQKVKPMKLAMKINIAGACISSVALFNFLPTPHACGLAGLMLATNILQHYTPGRRTNVQPSRPASGSQAVIQQQTL